LTDDHQYRPFNGIVLTDTFQLYEEDRDMIANLLPDNSQRRKNQRKRKINVIIGNPPYSIGQKAGNENAANQAYKNLDARIASTYGVASSAVRQVALYDSYIRAFRMASDRIGDEGVIGFVTGAGWIDGNATDGMRKCLVEEFDKIYVFNLRGNQRTSGELSRREGGKIFGSGSRSPIAITILVRKRGSSPRSGQILYCDIGDYFDREEKLRIVSLYKSISGIKSNAKWLTIQPDLNNDWLNKTESSFEEYMPLGVKHKGQPAVFENHSCGCQTSRDAWCYNFSKKILEDNVKRLIKFYQSEKNRYLEVANNTDIQNFVNRDPTKISWSRALYSSARNGIEIGFLETEIRQALYRPFTKTNFYFNKSLNEVRYQMPKIFPSQGSKNRLIMVSGIGANEFSCLMTDCITDLNCFTAGQCFPYNLFEEERAKSNDLFSRDHHVGVKCGVSDDYLTFTRNFYGKSNISVDEVFHYVYGVLHLPSYREKFKNNLLKELPRIPLLKSFQHFQKISQSGANLADLHLNFENASIYPTSLSDRDLLGYSGADEKKYFRVEKMRFAGKKGLIDKSTVIYNENITIKNIPLEAYEYVVNGKPALEWVMERQCVKVDKDSGIVNDANDYAIETMNNPAYPLELFQRVITVSLETMKIVKSLPPLDLS
jgi:predicted helicase